MSVGLGRLLDRPRGDRPYDMRRRRPQPGAHSWTPTVARVSGRLHDKVALITGAATGLGRVAAELFAREGATVVVADVADGADTVAAITAAGGRASFTALDVADDDERAGRGRGTRSTPTAASTCSTTTPASRPATTTTRRPPATTRGTRVLDVNVTGVARCCRRGIPALLAAGGGSIVNVASFVAHLGAATPQIAYTASKGAVLAMTREIAVTYARQGIRANALCPGPVLTPAADDVPRATTPSGDAGSSTSRWVASASRWRSRTAALFLASDESSFMTGQSLLIDGGITAAYTTPE